MSAIVVNIACGSRLPAGAVVNEGAEVPVGFIPGPSCEPLDADAANKFWAAGPFIPAIDLFVARPATFWLAVPGTANPNRLYSLTGPLGVGLGSKLGYS
jgi:hypothetical protein